MFFADTLEHFLQNKTRHMPLPYMVPFYAMKRLPAYQGQQDITDNNL